jgi:hypothetical protein
MVRFGTAKADRTGFTKNLSATGLCIRTNSVYKPGTTLQVEVQGPDKTYSMWAKVVWAKKVPAQLAHVLDCGMGLALVNPDPGWLEFLQDRD